MAEKFSVTVRDALKLQEGLSALDGVADKEGKVERFELDADLCWNAAKNRRIVDGAVETYQKAKKALGATHGVVDRMKLTEANAASVAKFIEGDEALLNKSVELTGILKLKRKELQAAGVKTPGILANLMPILSDA